MHFGSTLAATEIRIAIADRLFVCQGEKLSERMSLRVLFLLNRLLVKLALEQDCHFGGPFNQIYISVNRESCSQLSTSIDNSVAVKRAISLRTSPVDSLS